MKKTIIFFVMFLLCQSFSFGQEEKSVDYMKNLKKYYPNFETGFKLGKEPEQPKVETKPFIATVQKTKTVSAVDSAKIAAERKKRTEEKLLAEKKRLAEEAQERKIAFEIAEENLQTSILELSDLLISKEKAYIHLELLAERKRQYLTFSGFGSRTKFSDFENDGAILESLQKILESKRTCIEETVNDQNYVSVKANNIREEVKTLNAVSQSVINEKEIRKMRERHEQRMNNMMSNFMEKSAAIMGRKLGAQDSALLKKYQEKLKQVTEEYLGE